MKSVVARAVQHARHHSLPAPHRRRVQHGGMRRVFSGSEEFDFESVLSDSDFESEQADSEPELAVPPELGPSESNDDTLIEIKCNVQREISVREAVHIVFRKWNA